MSNRGNPSVVDVAKAAGVALGTTSRVMNGHPSVAPELREKVLAAARELGFRPKTARPTLVFLAHGPGGHNSWGYLQAVMWHLWRAAADKGFALEMVHVGELERARAAHVGGIISIGKAAGELPPGPLPPVVTIHHPLPERGFHHVATDHREQGRSAMEHLIRKGHRRIGMLRPGGEDWGARLRREGALEALSSAGLDAQALTIAPSDLPLPDILSTWLRQGITAILNFHEMLALEAIHILSNVLGRRIGTDISVISIEDLPVYQWLTPPQTAIRQSLAELCAAAVAAVTGPQGPATETWVPFELMVRESVADLTASRKSNGARNPGGGKK